MLTRSILIGLSAWAWIGLVFLLNYHIQPWETGTVQFFTTFYGLLLPVFVGVAASYPRNWE